MIESITTQIRFAGQIVLVLQLLTCFSVSCLLYSGEIFHTTFMRFSIPMTSTSKCSRQFYVLAHLKWTREIFYVNFIGDSCEIHVSKIFSCKQKLPQKGNEEEHWKFSLGVSLNIMNWLTEMKCHCDQSFAVWHIRYHI